MAHGMAVDFLAFVLGIIWLYAGVTKMLAATPSAEARRFVSVPPKLLTPLLGMLPWIETTLGLTLLSLQLTRIAALVSVALLTAFSAVLWVEYVGNSLSGASGNGSCGCFGQVSRKLIPALHRIAKQDPAMGRSLASKDVVRAMFLAVLASIVAYAA